MERIVEFESEECPECGSQSLTVDAEDPELLQRWHLPGRPYGQDLGPHRQNAAGKCCVPTCCRATVAPASRLITTLPLIGEPMNDPNPRHWRVSHHPGMCGIWRGRACDCAVAELDRIRKFLDGELVAPAPRGLCHLVAIELLKRDRFREALEEIRDTWSSEVGIKNPGTAYAIATLALDPDGCCEWAGIPTANNGGESKC